MERKEPYYENMQQVEFYDINGVKFNILTELLRKFSIEERIMFVDVDVHQGECVKTLDSLMSVRSVIIQYFDVKGSVNLQIESRCDFINTWSSFKGDYKKTDAVLKIKASFVLKSMSIKEQTDGTITNKIIF